GILNSYAIGAVRSDGAVDLNWGIYQIIDSWQKVCYPDAADIYMSVDKLNFEKIESISAEESTLTVSNLENDKIYYFRIVSLHCDLDSIVSGAIMIQPGPNQFPTLTGDVIISSVEKFRLSDDKQKVIYKPSSDEWYVADYNPMSSGKKLSDKSFHADWLPDNIHVACINLMRKDNALYSHSIDLYNVETFQTTNLHTIENLGDYYMGGLQASLDGNALFFYSNKSIGQSESTPLRNIWSLNMQSQELTKLTDFDAIDFEMTDFIEDPNNPNNFYIIGGDYEMYWSNRKYDIYYWNTIDQTLTPILLDAYYDKIESISPLGDKILLESSRSGRSEFWVYNLLSEQISQVSDWHLYGSNKFRTNVEWTDNNTLLVHMSLFDQKGFAEFKVD
ncbi:MAG: hypothetical protein HKN09_07430, partial [Saprospiraceae bacterium]|nr:hypothetical protein [Saprospiraceae bacterium]